MTSGYIRADRKAKPRAWLCWGRWAAAALALVLAAPPLAAGATPQEISPAEREAVALAIAYLSEGPEAWWRLLAEDSPLSRLDHQTAVAALEVRAGPPIDAHWQLQSVPAAVAEHTAVFTVEFPSGMEENLRLRLRESADGWRIHSVRMSSEPPQGFGAPADPAPPPPRRAAPNRDKTLPGILGGVAALLLILAIRRGVWFAVAGLLVAAGAGALLFLGLPGERPPATPAAAVMATDPEAELAGLLELRRALATADREAVEAARKTLPADGPAAQVARLWEAERALSNLELNAVDAALEAFPSPAAMPQAERVRARLGFLRLSEVETALAYDRLLEIDVWNDALLFEAAQAFDILGFAGRAERYYRELEKLGTRDAEVYYARAGAAIYDNSPRKAEDLFRQGWDLKPLTRDAVMGHMLLAFLVEESTLLQGLLDLDSASERKVKCSAISSRPLALPAGSQGQLLGGFLSLEVGAGELEVPGGCALAPPGVATFDAGAWRERRENLMLADLPVLRAAVRSKSLSRPRVRQEMEEAVAALARRGRWIDVIDVTEGLGAGIAGIPPAVVRQRAEALRRAGRRTEARELLTELAASNVKNKRKDPATLYQLAELLVTAGQYDLALKLMAKANSQLPFEIEPRRIRQVQMEKRLANASAVYESAHFEVFYPYERSLYFAERVSEILEAERQRLGKWIPVPASGKTAVYLLDFGDFRTGYSGNVEIIGLFDGKIRVPFAEVNTFIPYIVSVLTHELAHAMITEATGDRAPHWLQEGLAQHVEMPQEGINPISGYRSTGSLLSFPMIESVLESFAAPRFVPVAYDESRWVLHYIERRYGVRGIHRLLAAFRDGLTTEDAVAQVTGKSIADFDREIWDWCLGEAPDLWPSKIVHYDTYDAPVLVPDVYEEAEGEEDEGEDEEDG